MSERPDSRWWDGPPRRAFDLALTVPLLLVIAIPMLAIGALVRIHSPGPALHRQDRVGLGGRTFTMYKFRSMCLDAGDGPLRELIAAELAGLNTGVDGSFKLATDPRVTRVGRFLRRTSLDELPQLLNVLRGDMALVGPRPCLAWEADMFPAQFHTRFEVLPGMTGLWQVSGRSELSTPQMLALDVDYVRRRTARLYLTILLRTVPTLLARGDSR